MASNSLGEMLYPSIIDILKVSETLLEKGKVEKMLEMLSSNDTKEIFVEKVRP